MEYTCHYDSPLGGITLASDGKALSGLWFDGQKYYAQTLHKDHEEKDLDIFHAAKEWLDIYFSGNDPGFTPSLLLKTTPFRKRVCEIMLEIPYGRTMTYGEIAAVIAAERNVPHMSAQAVGSAVGHNPVSLIIPCHRVIGADGSLTGYAGGVEKKLALLKMEKGAVKKPPIEIGS
ncbi:MAG: methylated-DNA--[protein]-cysteine S-methyltransferase [Solobacterium sp.]|nr:methylated-DNA--[protein]-cysteine S-methyltransferase [Solobacterium sp.]